MISWHTTVANVKDLENLAAAQLQARSGDHRLRYSLEISSTAAHGAGASLTRHYRLPASLGGGRVKEEIRLDPAFAACLRALWPISTRTGRRAPQTIRSLLRALTEPRQAACADAEDQARERRWDALRTAFARAWPTGAPTTVIHDLRRYLGGRMPMHEAVDSDEALACVLSFVELHSNRAQPWAPRVRELASDFVTTFVAERSGPRRGRPSAPDAATVQQAVDMLTEHARSAVARGLSQALWQGRSKLFVELGSTAELTDTCLRLDAVLRRSTSERLQSTKDLPRIAELLHQLRDVVAAELLTQPDS